jgi:hypothetical protein
MMPSARRRRGWLLDNGTCEGGGDRVVRWERGCGWNVSAGSSLTTVVFVVMVVVLVVVMMMFSCNKKKKQNGEYFDLYSHILINIKYAKSSVFLRDKTDDLASLTLTIL